MGAGLGLLSQVVPPWFTTEQKMLCFSAESKVPGLAPVLEVAGSIPVSVIVEFLRLKLSHNLR